MFSMTKLEHAEHAAAHSSGATTRPRMMFHAPRGQRQPGSQDLNLLDEIYGDIIQIVLDTRAGRLEPAVREDLRELPQRAR